MEKIHVLAEAGLHNDNSLHLQIIFLHTLSSLNLRLTCETGRSGNHPLICRQKGHYMGDAMTFPRSQSQ